MDIWGPVDIEIPTSAEKVEDARGPVNLAGTVDGRSLLDLLASEDVKGPEDIIGRVDIKEVKPNSTQNTTLCKEI